MKKVLRLVRRSHHLKLTLKIKLKKIKDIHSLTTLPKFYRYSNLMWFNTSMSTSMNSQEKVLLLNMQFFLKKLQTFINFFVNKIANQPSYAISYNLLWTKMKIFLVQSFLPNYKSSNDTFIQVSHTLSWSDNFKNNSFCVVLFIIWFHIKL